MNKSITLLVFAFVACSSKTPVDMEEVLYDRSGQYITADNSIHPLSVFCITKKSIMVQDLYATEAGKKENRGHLKTDSVQACGQAGTRKEIKSFLGNMKRGKHMETGLVFTLMEKRNTKESTSWGFRQESGTTMI